MTNDPLWQPLTPPTRNGAQGRKCYRHTWGPRTGEGRMHAIVNEDPEMAPVCVRCGAVRNPAKARQGASNRRRGQSGERRSERRYGLEKIGERGTITDLRNAGWKVQQKTRKGTAPVTWTSIFGSLEQVKDHRTPLILFSFVRQGVAADDYFLIRGRDVLALGLLDMEPVDE